MLQWINDRVKVFGWFIVIPLGFTFAVWGVHGIVDFTSRSDRALKVNGEDVPTERIREAYMQQLAQLGRIYPGELPEDVRKNVQQRIVDEFVNTALIDQRTTQLHYQVSDADVVESIHAFKGFQVGGQFNRDAYFALLQERGYTPERFEAEQRQLLRSRSLEGGLLVSSFVTPLELKQLVALRDETRETGYAVLPVARFLPSAKVDEAAVKAYFEAHKDSYKTPESVRLRYVELKVSDIAAGVATDEAALRSYFDTVKERYVEPEKRHLRHILIPAGGDDAAARKKADEVYAEAVKPGADFAALARKYSQDAGTAAQGGDLGFAEKGFFVVPFADAAFAMKPGEIHAPVKTEFGWHVIKLEEISPGRSKSFDEVKAELGPEYQKSEAERRFGENQEKIEQLAFEQSGSLEPIAKAIGLKIAEIPDFHRGLAGNELAANPKVVAAAFSSDVLGGQNSKAIELAPGNVVVLRVSDHKVPEQQDLAAVHADVESAVRHEAAARDAAAAAARVVAALDGGATWEAALKPVGTVVPVVEGKTPPPDALRLEAPKFVGRTEPSLPPEVLHAAFAAATPAAGKRTVGSIGLATGDVAVYAVSAVKPGELKGDGSAERREFQNLAAGSDFATYLDALRANAEVHFNPAIFE
jgi:peptidyl-prolyl cis-trans isomerase D